MTRQQRIRGVVGFQRRFDIALSQEPARAVRFEPVQHHQIAFMLFEVRIGADHADQEPLRVVGGHEPVIGRERIAAQTAEHVAALVGTQPAETEREPALAAGGVAEFRTEGDAPSQFLGESGAGVVVAERDAVSAVAKSAAGRVTGPLLRQTHEPESQRLALVLSPGGRIRRRRVGESSLLHEQVAEPEPAAHRVELLRRIAGERAGVVGQARRLARFAEALQPALAFVAGELPSRRDCCRQSRPAFGRCQPPIE